MADLTKVTSPRLSDSHALFRRGPLYAGEVLSVGSPCYVASDGLVYMSFATAAVPGPSVNSIFDGFCIEGAAVIGDPVTLFGVGSIVDLSTTVLAIGDILWASDTPGEISDTAIATTADEVPIAKAVSASAVIVTRWH
jgi:hypothetical protein